MNIGLLNISLESLAGMLCLPKGHTITAIVPQGPGALADRSFMVLVEGPQLPEHHEGAFPQIVEMTFDRRGRGRFA